VAIGGEAFGDGNAAGTLCVGAEEEDVHRDPL
jgi:hypothetical protein